MNFTYAVFVLLLLSLTAPSTASGATRSVKPVPFISMSAMTGLFKRAYNFPKTTSVCQTFFYTLDSALNLQWARSLLQDGKVQDFSGGFMQPTQCSSTFNVTVDSPPGIPPRPVVFFKVGPIVYGKYEYVVYGRPDVSAVAIEVRDPKVFTMKYEEEVLKFSEEVLGVKEFTDLRSNEKCFSRLNV